MWKNYVSLSFRIKNYIPQITNIKWILEWLAVLQGEFMHNFFFYQNFLFSNAMILKKYEVES